MKRSKLSNFKIKISILQTGDKRRLFFTKRVFEQNLCGRALDTGKK
jgi:hypothetical protein